MNLVRLCTTMSAPHSNGTDEVRGGHGVVDDERDAVVVGDLADALDVEHVVARVGEHLTVERLGVRADGGAPLLEVVRVVDEGDLDAHLRQRVVEQVVRAAVQRRAGDDVVAGLGEGEDGERLGRLAASHDERAGQADGGGDATFEAARGGPRAHPAWGS